MYVISQLVWVLVAQPWGVMMDRFGRKPVVILGTLYPLSWLGYLFMNTGNYTYLLPLISLMGGLLAPAFWEGVNQMMLTLTPQRHRISYVAWYMTMVGVVSSGGPILGGIMRDFLDPVRIQVFPWLVLRSFQLVLLLSILCILASVLVMLRVKEGKEKAVGFVVSRITSPSIFRTFVNMDVIGKTPDHLRVARALRSIEGAKNDLALTEVLERLDDPHPEVREEAARALGRIGSSEALDALVVRLQDEVSPIRTHAARALGRIGDRRAIPYLIQGLASPSEDLQEACAQALGEIGGDESARQLFQLFREVRSEKVLASGAEAISRLGMIEAAWEILPRMHQTVNPVLQSQLAISVGNLLGPPGRFYRYITGNEEHHEQRVQRLFEAAARTVGQLDRRKAGRAETVSLSRAVREIGDLLEQCRNREALERLTDLGPKIVAIIRGSGVEAPEAALEDTLLHYPRLGLWWWFLGEARRLSGNHGNEQALVLDVLLGIFFLAYYGRGEYPFSQKWYAC